MGQGSINIGKVRPDLYRSTIAMSEQADAAAIESGLTPQLIELVRIRVSQINGCGFCLRAHAGCAREGGHHGKDRAPAGLA